MIVIAIAAYVVVCSRSASPYDDLFPRIANGMRRDDVEALLGPPTGAMSREETARILAGRPFDDVDAPPVNLQVATAIGTMAGIGESASSSSMAKSGERSSTLLE